MIHTLQQIYLRLLKQAETTHFRYLFESFNFNNRLIGLVGPRGVGKTTMLLQYIKLNFPDPEQAFYFSADHIFFRTNTLYEFVESLHLEKGIDYFFIDEIHKYVHWDQELKNLYDSFPEIKIAFSGSSSLNLVKGSYDLTRRAKLYRLHGLSFREYLNFYHGHDLKPYALSTLVENYALLNEEIASIKGVLGLYHEHLKSGFYPFFVDDPLSYYEKLLLTIEKTVYEDIANFYHLKTSNLSYFEKILNYLVSIPPGKISAHNIGKNLKIDEKTVANYLKILHEAGLVEMIFPAESGNLQLRRPEKVFLYNTNLYYALLTKQTTPETLGAIRELAFVQATKNAGLPISHNKSSDYEIDNLIFEIGGSSKTRKQLKGLQNGILVKDDMLMASHQSIPLYYFGFLY